MALLLEASVSCHGIQGKRREKMEGRAGAYMPCRLYKRPFGLEDDDDDTAEKRVRILLAVD